MNLYQMLPKCTVLEDKFSGLCFQPHLRSWQSYSVGVSVIMKALDGCYNILGISSNSKITEVKDAFKKKPFSVHPDKYAAYK